jgi:hydrogenase/urease accessory protein HupE
MRLIYHCSRLFVSRSNRYFFFCLAMMCFGEVSAHSLEQSYVFLNFNTEKVTGRIELTITDLNQALSLDLPTDHPVNLLDLKPYEQDISDYFYDRVVIHPDGEVGELRLAKPRLASLPKAQYLIIDFTLEGYKDTPNYLEVEYNVLFDRDPKHRAFLVVENNWETGTINNESVISLVFEPTRTTQILDLSSSTTFNGILGMVRSGMHHIWIGADHILFLIALLLPAVLVRKERSWLPVQSFRPALIYVLKIVSLFTLAHTITLSAATVSGVPLSSRLVESIIAISIAVAALDILYPIFHRRIWWVVFVFGLFHGFGFASVLSDLGIPSEYMGYSLLAFNVGVELGQLAIVCAVFPLLYFMRASWFYNKAVLQLGSVALIAISLYWFIERGFLIDLPIDENFWWALQKYNIYGAGEGSLIPDLM